MTEEASPEQSGYKKGKYTEMQQRVLDTVITEHGGNVIQAAKAAGYSNPYQVMKALRQELIDLAEDVVASFSIRAALKQGEILVAEDVIVQGNEKLKAAKDILERANPKAHQVELSGELKGGLFLLPDKRPLNE